MRQWTSILVLVGSLSLVACSSGGGDEPLDDATDNGVTLEDGDSNQANTAPQVSLAVSASGTAGEQMTLTGQVSDDGLPDGTLTYAWRKESGEGDVTFGTPNAASTTASFSRAGEYTVLLEVSDGEMIGSDAMVVTVAASNVDPSGLDNETPTDEGEGADSDSDGQDTPGEAGGDSGGQTDGSDTSDTGALYHSSGLSLVFDPEMLALTQDDLDWMFRVWEGMQACQAIGANAAPPEIRIVDSLGGEHNYDYTLSPAKVIVPASDVFFGKGANQGLALAKGFAAYMGNSARDNFDPHDVVGYTCYDWHSGGRHNPPPGRTLKPSASAAVSTTQVFDWSGTTTRLTTDGVSLSAADAGELAGLAAAVLTCNRQFAYTLGELRVVPADSSFEGDYWDRDGAFAVAGEGTLIVGYDGNASADWKRSVFDLLNRYAVSKIDHRIGYYECLSTDSSWYPQNPLTP